MAWTKEQERAIYEHGKNIIVSAGAGSGKTAVLTERVIEKLKSGININKLLILTFTNAAAAEMKDRIRKSIRDYPELKESLDYLESAYITTFDAYTLSLIKKYNDVLNVSKDLQIIDDSIIRVIKARYMEEIFEDLYKREDAEFLKFLDIFTIKNDREIKNDLLGIYEKLSLVSDLDSFLDNYFDVYFNSQNEEKYFQEYAEVLRNYLEEIETNLYYLENSDYPDYYEEMVKSLEKLLKSKTYDEIKENINVSIPRRPRGSEEIKENKENIDNILKDLKNELRFKDEKEIIETLDSTKDTIKVIIKIIKKFKLKLDRYKEDNDLYEFIDISKMAIKLLKDNPHILEEVKNSFQEICVDEYQDTNDLQEEFISLIENDNVYMVGDIKQSIYGFRNANPEIFKTKYDSYKDDKKGIRIDLLKNFRSRKEVIKGINDIFNLVMDDAIGGASYREEHQMNFGNEVYEKNAKENNDLEIISYPVSDEYNNNEIETFYIARDILKKIKGNYQVIDKDTKKLRCITYKDFCIIMDRGTDFTLYKKIFEYLNIPLEIWEDKALTKDIDVNIIYNILNLILKIKDNIFDFEFKYSFMSIGRSFLFSYPDKELFEILKNNNYQDTTLYKIAFDISLNLDNLTSYDLIKEVIDKFQINDKLITIGDVKEHLRRIDSILEMAKNVSDMGYNKQEFVGVLKDLINSKDTTKFKSRNSTDNAVKIMNIHKSKGLEFSICYYSGYYKLFNIEDVKSRFIFDKEYGLIVPFFKEGLDNTILYSLFKNKYLIENISEEIRLLYVALTRAKEKMVIVAPLNADNYISGIVPYQIRSKYNSFLSILNSISLNLKEYTHNLNIEDLKITKNYLLDNEKELEKLTSKEVITYKSINVEVKEVKRVRASKEEVRLNTLEEKTAMSKGEDAHKIFELTDFKNVSKDNKYYENITYLKDKLNINENTKIYKEYEFTYQNNNTLYQGIIDLLLVYQDKIVIVDYKLANTEDNAYLEQLKVYYNYLKYLFNKDIYIYLYSIENNKLTEKHLKETVR